MSYVLFAVLAAAEIFEPEPPWISDSRVVPLAQGLSMIPVTPGLYDGRARQDTPPSDADWDDFIMPPGPLSAPLQQLSQQGPVAYVEADFWGGVGEQRSIVWHNGQIVLGPLEEYTAINQALRRLGVVRQSFRDEFEAAGLDRHRSIDDWIESVISSPQRRSP